MKTNWMRFSYILVTFGLTPIILFFLVGKWPTYKPQRPNANSSSSAFVGKEPSAQCASQVQCLTLNLPVLKQLKNGEIKPSTKPRTIYLRTKARLGNVLFQFAALLALAKATCANVTVFSPYKWIDIFEEVPFTVVSPDELNRLSEGVPFFDMKYSYHHNSAIENMLQRDVRLEGFFITSVWFEGCPNYIKHKLRLKKKYLEKGSKIIQELINKYGHHNITTVGIHFRRGDKATEFGYNMGYRVPGKKYFDKAIAHFKQKHKNILFIATTDDRKWVEENFPHKEYPNMFLVPNNTYQVDFAILSQCDHVIQSFSTFGRWAAFMSGGESVYYRDGRVCFPDKNGKCDPAKYKPSNNSLYPGWIPMT